MTIAYAWAAITKVEEQDDGTVLVTGPVSDGGLDRDRQRLDQTWLDQAMPKWMAEGANVREQHLATRAVGVGVDASRTNDGTHHLTALVVDPVAVKKVQTGVLKGFSVGIREPRLDMGKADAPNGVIVGGDIIEVSLVDRPANPRTRFVVAKADGAGELAEVEEPEVEEFEDDDEAEEAAESAPEEPAVPIEPETQPAEESEVDKTETPDATKAEGAAPPVAYLTKAEGDAIVKAAVAEAIKPLEGRLAKAEAEAVLVKADLAKALEMPAGGGPVATRTAAQTQAARANDAAALRAHYLAKADATDDPDLRKGFRDLAAQVKD